MGKRPMRTCRLAFAVPVEANADASQENGGGVEWRDVSCYETDDASLVVHENADDSSVYSLSHAPTGLVILTEATGSPDPVIELANRLSRMTDWAAINATEGINGLPARTRKRITTEVYWFNRRMRLASVSNLVPVLGWGRTEPDAEPALALVGSDSKR